MPKRKPAPYDYDIMFDAYGNPLRFTRDGRMAAPRQEEDPGLVPTPFGLIETPLFQERQGIRDLVRSEKLPKDMDVEVVKKLGFEILGPTRDEKLFVDVKFPAGWKQERSKSDHRTTYLVDPVGHRRAYVWYKASSYDSAAYLVVRRRFDIQVRHNKDYTKTTAYVVDELETYPAIPRVVFKTKIVKGKGIKDYAECEKEAQALAVAWTKKHLPEASDHLAYWNDAPLPEVCPLPAY